MLNYIKKLRQKLGKQKIIYPGARILVENEKGEILFIEKTTTGQVGLPAGGLEENETIEMCIKREVQEETGLVIQAVEVIGISSHPQRETVSYENGDVIQYFTVEFYSNKWTGTIAVTDTEEIKSAAFRSKKYLKKLPVNEQSIIESLAYYKKYKKIRLS